MTGFKSFFLLATLLALGNSEEQISADDIKEGISKISSSVVAALTSAAETNSAPKEILKSSASANSQQYEQQQLEQQYEDQQQQQQQYEDEQIELQQYQAPEANGYGEKTRPQPQPQPQQQSYSQPQQSSYSQPQTSSFARAPQQSSYAQPQQQAKSSYTLQIQHDSPRFSQQISYPQQQQEQSYDTQQQQQPQQQQQQQQSYGAQQQQQQQYSAPQSYAQVTRYFSRAPATYAAPQQQAYAAPQQQAYAQPQTAGYSAPQQQAYQASPPVPVKPMAYQLVLPAALQSYGAQQTYAQQQPTYPRLAAYVVQQQVQQQKEEEYPTQQQQQETDYPTQQQEVSYEPAGYNQAQSYSQQLPTSYERANRQQVSYQIVHVPVPVTAADYGQTKSQPQAQQQSGYSQQQQQQQAYAQPQQQAQAPVPVKAEQAYATAEQTPNPYGQVEIQQLQQVQQYEAPQELTASNYATSGGGSPYGGAGYGGGVEINYPTSDAYGGTPIEVGGGYGGGDLANSGYGGGSLSSNGYGGGSLSSSGYSGSMQSVPDFQFGGFRPLKTLQTFAGISSYEPAGGYARPSGDAYATAKKPEYNNYIETTRPQKPYPIAGYIRDYGTPSEYNASPLSDSSYESAEAYPSAGPSYGGGASSYESSPWLNMDVGLEPQVGDYGELTDSLSGASMASYDTDALSSMPLDYASGLSGNFGRPRPYSATGQGFRSQYGYAAAASEQSPVTQNPGSSPKDVLKNLFNPVKGFRAVMQYLTGGIAG